MHKWEHQKEKNAQKGHTMLFREIIAEKPSNLM